MTHFFVGAETMNQKKSNPFVSIVVIAAMLILVVVAGIR